MSHPQIPTHGVIPRGCDVARITAQEQGGGGGGWCSRVPPPSFFKVYKLHNGLLWLPMVKKGCNRASGTRNVERLRRVPRSTVKKVLRVARRISGFKFSETRRVPRMGFLLGHRVPRCAPGEPNKPVSMGLIRSSSFSRFRTIVWPRLNFQIQSVSVS
ncbi:hypothetical protein E3N88_35445 [Mikania micrantha]|uniref:Uncharacterized protein n=1 Tax=Mikania micrantha TaxID=192012 RepID=A0A5N6M0Z6_9ASTR|nr:hypothetical protein E3N88_35445 [Mikania micrantha]